MREIQLSQSKVALVDDEDYDRVNEYKWQAYKNKKGNSTYARVNYDLTMHRLILNLTSNDKVEVDHIDMNGLNNQKSNLRIVNRSQNKCNATIQKNNKTGLKGVGYYKRGGHYRARIKINGKETHLGFFDTAEEAGAAYDKASKEIHGVYGRVNGVECKYDPAARIIKPEVKGFYFNKHSKKWQAYLPTKSGNKFLGLFDTEKEASEAFKKARASLETPSGPIPWWELI